MICHRCLEEKLRKDWTPSQWTKGSSILYPYLGCKKCHAWPPPELVEAARGSLRLRQFDVDDFGQGQAAFLSEFRERHVTNIKQYSQYGALQAVCDFHPQHWHDVRTDAWYFDPSNYVYKAAVQFACPEFIVQSGVSNEERAGDTIEAILGLDFLLEAGGPQNQRERFALYPQSRVSLHNAARFWKIMSYHEFVISWLLTHWPNSEDALRTDEPEPDTPTSPTAGTGTAATTARNTSATSATTPTTATTATTERQPTATSSSDSTARPTATPKRRRWGQQTPMGDA